MAGSDFNYKVALASGLRHLQAGQPHKAEEQFRYLRDRYPHADGGYRGIARIRLEVGDQTGAVAALREGAAALAKAGERAGAIGLLREIVSLEPADLGAHRRLAAALILAGDREAALAEHTRFVALMSADPEHVERARLEIVYAREQLADTSILADVAERIGPPTPRMPEPAPQPAPPAVTAHLATDELESRATLALARGEPGAGAAVVDAATRHLAEGHLAAAADLVLAGLSRTSADRALEQLQLDVAAALGATDAARDGAALLARLRALDGHREPSARREPPLRTP